MAPSASPMPASSHRPDTARAASWAPLQTASVASPTVTTRAAAQSSPIGPPPGRSALTGSTRQRHLMQATLRSLTAPAQAVACRAKTLLQLCGLEPADPSQPDQLGIVRAEIAGAL